MCKCYTLQNTVKQTPAICLFDSTVNSINDTAARESINKWMLTVKRDSFLH